MIIESGIIHIKPGEEAKFEAGFATARPAIEAAPGCHKIEMRRGIETPSDYLILVWWDSVQAHMGFRASEAFQRWRAPIGAFFAAPPQVFHYEAPL
jgi:heme-degrading monooxygenase HmoA